MRIVSLEPKIFHIYFDLFSFYTVCFCLIPVKVCANLSVLQMVYSMLSQKNQKLSEELVQRELNTCCMFRLGDFL